MLVMAGSKLYVVGFKSTGLPDYAAQSLDRAKESATIGSQQMIQL
jgi:hypothetical protein